MFLVFDVETTGLPKRRNARMQDVDNWPRVIQIAWAHFDNDGSLKDERVDLIKPDGWTIPKEKFWIDNGFNQAISEKDGIPIKEALNPFCEKIEQSDILIAHNMEFDYNVVGAEFLRIGLKSKHRPQRYCTKEGTTDLCKIPGNYGYKWPTLMELHQHLFDKTFEGGHDALIDVKACARCYLELQRQNIA